MAASDRLFRPAVYPDEFMEFWKAYPSRKKSSRKGDKQLAYEMWSRLDLTEKRWCLYAAKQLAKDVQSDAMVAWDAERFFVAERDGGKTPRWQQYAEKEMEADAKAIARVQEIGFDHKVREHVDQLHTQTDPVSLRVARLLEEGAFG